MKKNLFMTNHAFVRRVTSLLMLVVFSATTILMPAKASAQSIGIPGVNLPAVGTMLGLSESFHPAIIRGMTVYPDNPLKFDFIVNTGDKDLKGQALEKESQKLIKYFLASLTTPENEFWVNLSPYESGRIIPEALGTTEMGRDMLAQDYILKQLTASLLYPEKDLGNKFWQRVHEKAKKLYGVSEVKVDTFNKVWIMPDKASVYENDNHVFVVERHLKVMLEEDYDAMQRNISPPLVGGARGGVDVEAKNSPLPNPPHGGGGNVVSKILKELIIPEIEKEVNEGENFAGVRQIYNSMILATWYKKRLKESLLGQVYVNQNKVKGIDLADKETKQKIYQQYLAAFKKGVYNYIKEDVDALTNEPLPRKYFSGGLTAGAVTKEGLRVYEGSLEGQPKVVSAAVTEPLTEKGNDVVVSSSLVENATQDQVTAATPVKPTLEVAIPPSTFSDEKANTLTGAAGDLTVSNGKVSQLPDSSLRGQGETSGDASSSAIRELLDNSVLLNILQLSSVFSVQTRLRAIDNLVKSNDPRVRDLIRGLLNDDNPQIKARAAKAIGQLNDQNEKGPLLLLLSHDSFEVRKSAREALKRLGTQNDELIGGDIQALSASKQARLEAAKELAILGKGNEKVYKALKSLLKDTDPDIVSIGIESFVARGNREIIPTLVDMLNKETNPRVLGALAFAMGEFNYHPAINQLKQLLKYDMPFDLIIQVIKVLNKLGEPVSDEFLIEKIRLTKQLSFADVEFLERSGATQAQLVEGYHAVLAGLSLEVSIERSIKVANKLAALGDQRGVRLVIDALKKKGISISGYDIVEAGKNFVIEHIPEDEGVDSPEEYYDWKGTNYGHYKIGGHPESYSVTEIKNSQPPSASSAIIAKATIALGRKGFKSAIPSLLKLLGHEDAKIRLEAEEVLAKLGPATKEQMVEGYILALQGSSFRAIENALQKLIKLGVKDNRATKQFLNLLDHEDESVRSAADEALTMFGVTNDQLMEKYSQAVERFSLLGERRDKRTIESLLRLLENKGKDSEIVYRKALEQFRLTQDQLIARYMRVLMAKSEDSFSKSYHKLVILGGREAVLVEKMYAIIESKLGNLNYWNSRIFCKAFGEALILALEGYNFSIIYIPEQGYWEKQEVPISYIDGGQLGEQDVWVVTEPRDVLILKGEKIGDPFVFFGKDDQQGKTLFASTDKGASSSLITTPVGGIDFNSAALDLQIKRDGNGVPLPLPQQTIQNMKIDGFYPVIINIAPVNIPLLLGQKTQKEPQQLSALRSVDFRKLFL